MENKQVTNDLAIEDRVSTLPQEIIHEILDRLGSPKQVSQLNILSKTWSHLIQSYPVIDFHENYCVSWETEHRHANKILEKLSQGNSYSVRVVRIETIVCSQFYYDFYDRLLGFAAEFPLLREIDIDFGSGRCDSPGCGVRDSSKIVYRIPASFFTPNGKQFARLDTLKLKLCRFYHYESLPLTNFSCLGSSLKVLCLEHVEFPNVEILHSMIDHASLLETLTLKIISVGDPDEEVTVHKFHIRNHPNLKILNIFKFYIDLLEIAGIDSLEEVGVMSTGTKDFKMWSTPNLKVLQIEGLDSMELINKLISEHPSLESLTLECPHDLRWPRDNDDDDDNDDDNENHDDETRELKIVGFKNLREVTLKYSQILMRDPSFAVTIDAPMLTKFAYQGDGRYFPAISIRNPVGSSELVAASVTCQRTERSCVNVYELKKFLFQLSPFELTVEFPFFRNKWDNDRYKSPAAPPAVECLKFQAKPPSYDRHLHTNLDYFFQCCRPKLLSFTESASEQVPDSSFLSNLENMCKQFTERDCKTGCNCWRHQLKDVKMMSKIIGESTSVEKDKVMEVAMDTVSSLGQAKQEVWFVLTWH
ncbi:hypothetical protein LINGRAHAP2_LOCUS28514 [Linum grandiflorum]